MTNQKKHSYVIYIQFLGFRYHGWQKQPGFKTIELMVEKTIGFVLGHDRFNILGAGRTDAKVSALKYAFELGVNEPLEPEQFILQLNINLPNDIRALSMETAPQGFNIIQSPKIKEYRYLFCQGKSHPFGACLVSFFNGVLDIELMKSGAAMFKGTHDFTQYCTQPGPDTQTIRTVEYSGIAENDFLEADFFSEPTWVFQIRSKGFMRNQVRLMMGQLIRLGRYKIGLSEIKNSLEGNSTAPLPCIAPASGLMLYDIVI